MEGFRGLGFRVLGLRLSCSVQCFRAWGFGTAGVGLRLRVRQEGLHWGSGN